MSHSRAPKRVSPLESGLQLRLNEDRGSQSGLLILAQRVQALRVGGAVGMALDGLAQGVDLDLVLGSVLLGQRRKRRAATQRVHRVERFYHFFSDFGRGTRHGDRLHGHRGTNGGKKRAKTRVP